MSEAIAPGLKPMTAASRTNDSVHGSHTLPLHHCSTQLKSDVATSLFVWQHCFILFFPNISELVAHLKAQHSSSF